MRLTSISLKNFRCFASLKLDLDSPLVLLVGPNGAGKTSILEALHYSCYLRSFKTHLPKELVRITQDGFSAALEISSDGLSLDTLNVSFANSKRAIKVNQKPVSSYKDLYSIYKVITITEDDLELVKGAPLLRRSFIDNMLIMLDPAYANYLRKYRSILDNRNALLNNRRSGSSHFDHESYVLWTDQLLKTSYIIQSKRQAMLKQLEQEAHELAISFFDDLHAISIVYEYARPYLITNFEASGAEFIEQYPNMPNHELSFRRSLFGSHLDDFRIIFQDKASRSFASRGQQKLIVFLLKLAQLKIIVSQTSAVSDSDTCSAIFLIDDFISDFDEVKTSTLLSLITRYATQVIITSPTSQGILQDKLTSYGVQVVSINNQLY